jgi:HSP20 family protein
MATAAVQVKKTESIFDELNNLHHQIMKRAFEIFHGNGQAFGQDLDNWLQAERELVWKPAIQLEEKDNQFRLQIATPGVDPKDIDIEVTPDYVLVKAENRREREGQNKEIHISEFTSGNMFRSIHLPKKIDPDKVKAEFKNGILLLTAGIAKEAQARRIELKAS